MDNQIIDPEFVAITDRFLVYWNNLLAGKSPDVQTSIIGPDTDSLYRQLTFGISIEQTGLSALKLTNELLAFAEQNRKVLDWLDLLHQAEPFIDSLPIEEKFNTLLTRGKLFRRSGNVKRGIEDHELAEKVAFELEGEGKLAKVYIALAHDYLHSHQFELALHFGNKSLELNSFEITYDEALTHSVIGIASLEQSKAETSIWHLKLAINLLAKDGRAVDQARMTNQIARAHHTNQNYKAAESYYDQAFDLYLELDDPIEMSRITLNKAALMLDWEHLDKVITLLEEIDQFMLKRLHQYELLGYIYYVWGLCLKEQGKLDLAVKSLMQATEYWQTAKNSWMVATGYFSLAEMSVQMNNAKSLQHYSELAKEKFLTFPNNEIAQNNLKKLDRLAKVGGYGDKKFRI